jgi:hypothetical protein
LLCAVVLGAVAAAPAAHAQEEPAIAVTPSTGLQDGQLVTVSGTGFSSVAAIAALECPPQFAGRTTFTITEVLANCAFISTGTIGAPAGNLTVTVPVQEVFTPSSGGASYDCTVRNDCLLLVAGLGGSIGLVGATAPISFGSPVPQSKADCKNGGWRSLDNDQGQPFRNQGQCVSYANGRR